MSMGKEWEAKGLESAGREGGGVATGSGWAGVVLWVADLRLIQFGG